MRSRRSWLGRPPRGLRRPGIRLDNVALVPASLLPYKKQWQAIANGLSRNGVLIILPSSERRPWKALRTVASLLKNNGRQVTTLRSEQFANNATMIPE